MVDGTRKQAETRGRRAEDLVAFWLQLKGYKIIERRLKTPFGEIDLMARKGKLLVCIEVKQRPDKETAQASLHPANLGRIERAAFHYQGNRDQFQGFDLRFDAVFVLPRLRMLHIKDAWRAY